MPPRARSVHSSNKENTVLHNIMEIKYEAFIRGLALTKGLKLMLVETRSTLATEKNLYKLTAENGFTIFPPENGPEEGAPLHEAKAWLIQNIENIELQNLMEPSHSARACAGS